MKGNSNPAGGSGAARQQAAGDGFNLNATTEAFRARFQQQKKEQDQALSEAESAARLRQKLIVQALTTIRKSLLELKRIELGERFRLEIAADEWRGWPRITVLLADNVLRTADYPKLQVTANDRQDKGLIEINSGAPPTATTPTIVTVSMREEADLARLPVVLKRSVRNFLDTIAQTILEAEKRLDRELEEAALAQRQAADFNEKSKDKSAPELSGDLFEDAVFTKGPFEMIDSIDEVRSLPSLEDGAAGARTKKAAEQQAEGGRKKASAEKSAQAQSKSESSKLDAVEDLFLSQMLKD